MKNHFQMEKELTAKQRENLLILMHRAFVEIRILGWQAKSEQAADLADAFHNLPTDMNFETFSFHNFRNLFLKSYCQKYSDKLLYNYLAMVDRISNDENLDDI